jgi:hypothetical protein
MTDPKSDEIALLHPGQYVLKRPAASMRVGFDWSDDKLVRRAGIGSSSWIVSSRDVGLLVEDDAIDDCHVIATLTGGTVGQQFVLTNRVVTVSGERCDRAVVALIREAPGCKASILPSG